MIPDKASDRDIRSLLPRHSRKGRKPRVRGPEECRLLDSLLLQFEKEARPSKAKMVHLLATNPALLQATREKLRRNRTTTPLYDSERFAKNIEAAYEAMVKAL